MSEEQTFARTLKTVAIIKNCVKTTASHGKLMRKKERLDRVKGKGRTTIHSNDDFISLLDYIV
jgi:hypothetical protein